MGSGSTPLLPSGGTGRAARTKVAFALLAIAACTAAVFSTYFSAQPVVLVQFDGFVQRERAAWDAVDSGIMESRPLARAPVAFSQLRSVRTSGQAISVARAQQEERSPMVRKEWSTVDRIVGLMDAEDSEFTSLQELAKVGAGIWCLHIFCPWRRDTCLERPARSGVATHLA